MNAVDSSIVLFGPLGFISLGILAILTGAVFGWFAP